MIFNNRKPTWHKQRAAFLRDLIAVCRKHNTKLKQIDKASVFIGPNDGNGNRFLIAITNRLARKINDDGSRRSH